MNVNKILNDTKDWILFLLQWIWQYSGLKNGARIFYQKKMNSHSSDANSKHYFFSEFEMENDDNYCLDRIESFNSLERWEEDGGYVEDVPKNIKKIINDKDRLVS